MCAKKLDTETRQEQIAEAALAVVAAQGVKALSVAAVAERVGVVPSAIYRHYRSKEDVLDAVLDVIASRHRANVRTVCEETDHALDRLHRLLMRHVRLIQENQAIPSVIFSDDIYDGDKERRLKAGALILDYVADVERIVHEGQQQGHIRPEHCAQTVATLFLGILQPASIISHLDEGSLDLEKHAREAWGILEGAIGVESTLPL